MLTTRNLPSSATHSVIKTITEEKRFIREDLLDEERQDERKIPEFRRNVLCFQDQVSVSVPLPSGNIVFPFIIIIAWTSSVGFL